MLATAEESGGDPDTRLVAPVVAGGGEEVEEAGLRPRSLTEFVGQAQLVEHLVRRGLEDVQQRGSDGDHIQLSPELVVVHLGFS